jgi:hypothetical protein
MTLTKRTFFVGFAVFSLAATLLAIFSPSTPRVFLNHRRAAESMRELSRAENNYAALHSDAGFACNLSQLGEHASESSSGIGLVDPLLASGTKNSYRFEIQCPQSRSQKVTGYTITATPVEPGFTGKFALCANQSGETWYSENGLAADCLAMHQPIERKYR